MLIKMSFLPEFALIDWDLQMTGKFLVTFQGRAASFRFCTCRDILTQQANLVNALMWRLKESLQPCLRASKD